MTSPHFRPFLVESTLELTAATPPSTERTTPGIRLVFRGLALRPGLTAAVAAQLGMAGIGLFLGLMLGMR